jgi:5'-nucleotidase
LFTVRATCIPAETLEQIKALGADTVTLLGGTEALSTVVEQLTPCEKPLKRRG